MLIHLSLISHYDIYTCISFFLSYITCCIVFHESNSKAAALVLRPQCTCSRCPTLALFRTSCKRGSIKDQTQRTHKNNRTILLCWNIFIASLNVRLTVQLFTNSSLCLSFSFFFLSLIRHIKTRMFTTLVVYI